MHLRTWPSAGRSPTPEASCRAGRQDRRIAQVPARGSSRHRRCSGTRGSQGQLPERFLMHVHHPIGGLEHTRLMIFVDRENAESIPVYLDLEWGLTVDSQEIEELLLDDDAQLFADGSQILDHRV